MTPERKRHLIVSSLSLRAVQESNLHYGGELRGIAKELTDLADEIEAEALPGNSADAWLDT